MGVGGTHGVKKSPNAYIHVKVTLTQFISELGTTTLIPKYIQRMHQGVYENCRHSILNATQFTFLLDSRQAQA